MGRRPKKWVLTSAGMSVLDISENQREILGVAHGFFQNGLEGGVHLHGKPLPAFSLQRLGQRTDAGTISSNTPAALVNSCALGNFPGDPALGQKVLSLGF